MKQLSDTPSTMIYEAIKDLEEIEKNPNYIINMDEWHKPHSVELNKCEVCLAGSVMANTLKVPTENNVSPVFFKGSNYSKLCALDNFRQGSMYGALALLNISIPTKYSDKPFPITPYAESPTLFKKDMWELAEDLESEGL